MLKKVLLTSLVLLLTTSLVAVYFFFVGRKVNEASGERVCRRVSVRIADSHANRLISADEVLSTVGSGALFGRRMDSLDLYGIEKTLSGRGEVLSCQAYFPAGDSTLVIEVNQRKAALRLITPDGESYYCDREGYVFPVLSHVDVPVITGHIPVILEEGRRGFTFGEEKKWLCEALELISWIESHSQWRNMFSQIDVEPDGEFDLYPMEGGVHFIIGDSSDMDTKFRKISQFYRGIEPAAGCGRYSCVNVKYKNQIICR